MKKFTKIMIGAGLTVAALGAAAAPANAAPVSTDATVAVAGQSVLEGKFLAWNAANSYSAKLKFGYSTYNGNLQLFTSDIQRAETVQIPMPGTTGKIKFMTGPSAGKCMSTPPTTAPGGAKLLDCSAPNTDITIDTKGFIIAGGMGWNSNGWSAPIGSTANDSIDISDYTVVAVGSVPVDVTGPSAGETVPTKNPTFSGTGDEGATVVVKDENGQELCRTTVTGGVWSCTTTLDMPDGNHTATADQTATDGTTSSDSVAFVVADGAGGPVMDPMIAGGAGLVLLAAAGAVIALKRRQSAPAAL